MSQLSGKRGGTGCELNLEILSFGNLTERRSNQTTQQTKHSPSLSKMILEHF